MKDIFEVMMIVCFGLSWPVSIFKSYKSKSTKGKSIFFLVFILLGYACGIFAKAAADRINYVLIFYTVNFVMVLADILLYLKNKRAETQ